MIVQPPQGGDRAVHHGHGGCDEETEDVDGSEEGTVRLRCQVPQVSFFHVKTKCFTSLPQFHREHRKGKIL